MLDKPRLKAALIAAMSEEAEAEDAAAARDRICDKMATAIINEIKQLKITYTTGMVAGGTGVTGTFNNTLS